jgi:Tol biopolymer transport system component
MRSLHFAAFVIAGAVVACARDASAQQPIEGVSVNADGTRYGGVEAVSRYEMSLDGRYVVVACGADLAGGDQNSQDDVYVRDRTNGVAILMSVGTDGMQSDGACYLPSISGDGRFVAFASNGKFDPVDVNNVTHVYLHDRDPDGNGIFDEAGATTSCSAEWDSASDDYSSRPAGATGVVVFEGQNPRSTPTG